MSDASGLRIEVSEKEESDYLKAIEVDNQDPEGYYYLSCVSLNV